MIIAILIISSLSLLVSLWTFFALGATQRYMIVSSSAARIWGYLR